MTLEGSSHRNPSQMGKFDGKVVLAVGLYLLEIIMYLVVIFDLFRSLLVYTRKDSTRLEEFEFHLETRLESKLRVENSLLLTADVTIELKSSGHPMSSRPLTRKD